MINLPSELQTILTIGGITIETDASAAVTAVNIDYIASTLTFRVQEGTANGQNLTVGQYCPFYDVVVNFDTGIWNIPSMNLSGTATSMMITQMQTGFLNLRNLTEGFIVNVSGLLPNSTQTTWTSI